LNIEKAIKAYLPMSETMYYILLALREPRHGYGIMLHVENLTQGRMRIGAGTIYSSISKLEKDGLIVLHTEEERRKVYKITNIGFTVLKEEVNRLKELYTNGREIEKEAII